MDEKDHLSQKMLSCTVFITWDGDVIASAKCVNVSGHRGGVSHDHRGVQGECVGDPLAHLFKNWFKPVAHLISNFTLVNYDSRVVVSSKFHIFMTLDS